MKTISTRELAHRTKAVREFLEAGEPLAWMANGKVVAYLRPAENTAPIADSHDWLSRAKASGAVNNSTTNVSSMLYDDRG